MDEPPITDLTGTTLGEYQVVSRIGKGGMGVVYEGRHPLIGKRVAVKVLTAQASTQADAVDRFLAEARAVNAIRHRGIVDIFGFGKVPGGSQYFVMELLEGLPFDEVIRMRAPVAPADALRWIDEVLDALDAAHHAGVIHRDIKPSNLFLVDSGRGTPYVKLLDFGIAKLVPFRGQTTPQTNMNAVVGTPDYMAPEQARGQPISGLTDLYALGCVLHELLTGQRIFSADGPLEVMFAHVERAPVPPSKLNPKVPAIVDAFVLRLVAKKPEDRPPNAHDARAELHAVLRKLGEPASVPSPSDRTLQPIRPMPISGATENVAGPDRTVMVPSTQSRVVRRSRTNLSAAVVAAAVLVSASMALLFWPKPAPVVEVVVLPQIKEVVPLPVVAIDAGAVERPMIVEAVEPPEVIDAGANAAVIIKPVGPLGPKKDSLGVRLARLKVQLDQRDKKTGERDRILHRLLDAAEKNLQTAKTAEDRKAVSAQFDDLQSQLR